jgi:sortase A
MRVRVRPVIASEALGVFLRLVCWMALAGAAVLLVWPATVLVDSQLAQWSGARKLERQILLAQAQPREKANRATSAEEVVVPETTEPATSSKAPGEVLARLEIDRLKMKYVLLEGTDARTLDRSIGHIRNTALPGQTGNIGIAGHRNTHFRRLEWIRRNDQIVLTSPRGAFRYTVEWVAVFEPADLQVLDASHGPALTLVTCFPFEYVGSATLRFVVRALPDEQTRLRLQAAQPAAAGG